MARVHAADRLIRDGSLTALGILPDPVRQGRGQVQVLGQEQGRDVVRVAMVVEVGRVPVTRVHVDPAIGAQFDLAALADAQIELDGYGPMLGPSLRANTIASRPQIDLDPPRHDEVMLVSLVVSDDAGGVTGAPAASVR